MTQVKRGVDRRQSAERPEFPLRLESGDVAPADRRNNGERRQNGFISRQSFFRDVPYSELEPLIANCAKRPLQPGEMLLEPGQSNHFLYLLLDGKLKVHIDKADSEEAFTILPGECAGEISIVDGKPATAFVIADQPSRVLAIPEGTLWREFFRIPEVARNFMRLFAGRFRDRNQVMQQALEQQLRWEHLQRELAIAHDIQASMLPTGDQPCRRCPEVDIQAKMTPASQVGGDFFDTFPLDDRRICLAIGDVSGKGIPAALFMVRTMTLLREEMLKRKGLTEAVRNLNIKLCQDNPVCMFATLIVGVLDVEQARFSYVNAGHNRPLFGPGGGTFDFLEPTGGILVGVNEQAEYRASDIPLNPGDVLVLYSDGVTEAMNHQQELFTDQRFSALLSGATISGANRAIQLIESAVREFAAGAPQSDDLTLLVLEYRGETRQATA